MRAAVRALIVLCALVMFAVVVVLYAGGGDMQLKTAFARSSIIREIEDWSSQPRDALSLLSSRYSQADLKRDRLFTLLTDEHGFNCTHEGTVLNCRRAAKGILCVRNATLKMEYEYSG